MGKKEEEEEEKNIYIIQCTNKNNDDNVKHNFWKLKRNIVNKIPSTYLFIHPLEC